MSEWFWCLLVDIETCEKDLAKLVLVSVEDQRDTPSPLSADSPSPSPVFLTSPQHHSSSSSACSLSSSGSDIVRPKDFYLPFSFWWHHQVLLRSSQFTPDHMAVLCRLQLHRILHSFCPPPLQESESPPNSAVHLHPLTLASVHSVIQMAADPRVAHPTGFIHNSPQVCFCSTYKKASSI